MPFADFGGGQGGNTGVAGTRTGGDATEKKDTQSSYGAKTGQGEGTGGRPVPARVCVCWPSVLASSAGAVRAGRIRRADYLVAQLKRASTESSQCRIISIR